MRVVDHPELEPGVLDLARGSGTAPSPSISYRNGLAAVLRARWTAHGLAVPRGDHAAALVRCLGAGVLDDLVEQGPGDPHYSGVPGALASRLALDVDLVVIVVVVERVMPLIDVLELAHALAERPAHLGQALRARGR